MLSRINKSRVSVVRVREMAEEYTMMLSSHMAEELHCVVHWTVQKAKASENSGYSEEIATPTVFNFVVFRKKYY